MLRRDKVALRKESVDRNRKSWDACCPWTVESLSARRAWIEIPPVSENNPIDVVALRKESVDRNWTAVENNRNHYGSLSARRAWIEIFMTLAKRYGEAVVALRKESVDRNSVARSLLVQLEVALRKESVDRNVLYRLTQPLILRRSPQGERG